VSYPLIRNRFLIVGLFIAIMIWLLDVALDTYQYHAPSFWSELFDPSGIAIVHRTLLSLLVLVFVAYVLWATRQMRRNEERFELVLSGINGGIWEWDPQTDALHCSPYLIHTVLGYAANDLTNMTLEDWADLIHPDEKQHVLQAIRDMADGRSARYQKALPMRHQRGHWVQIRFRAFPEQQHADGKPKHIIGTCADITEQKRTEDGYFLKAEQLKVMLDTTTDGYWLVDKNGRILDTNAAYCDMTGFPREKVINHAISDFELVETPKETAEHIQKVLAEGFDRFESKQRCKDGRIIDVEVSVSYMENQGLFISFLRDITERKKHKNELLRLSRVVEQTSEGVLIVNRKGIIEYVNPAFCHNTGYTKEEAIGQRPSLLKSGAQDESFYAHMWDAISKGESWSGSVVDRRKDGSFFPSLLSIFPVHDEAGENTQFVGIQRDLSELKNMEDQFLQAQKMETIGTLVSGIAHDFNNILAAVEANTYLVRAKMNNEPQEAIGRLGDIETLTKRATKMIHQMLAFARKNTMQMKNLSLTAFAKESLKLSRTAIPENIEFVSDICEEELFINGDSSQLQQVIMNLLNNANDAETDVEQPRIEYTLHSFGPTARFRENHPDIQAERLACLTIRDNGIGIAEDHLTKIFEPFFTTKGAGKGTGLGLAMAYGAIKNHSGCIDVESKPGKGTAFHIYLPLTENPAAPKSAGNSAILEGKGETILLVDDEEYILKTTGDVLNNLGYRVLTATNGLDAIARLRGNEDTVALIVSDVVMPRMGGMDFARVIREEGDDTPIIFATGYGIDHKGAPDQRIKHSIVVNKPFSLHEISHIIRNMIEAN